MIPGGSVNFTPRGPYPSLFDSELKWVSYQSLVFFSAPGLLLPQGWGVGRHDMVGGTWGRTQDTQPPSLSAAKSNLFRPGFPSCEPKSEELKSFLARTMSTALDISSRNLVRGQTRKLWPITTEPERVSGLLTS